jgi:hypothetical protein
MSGPTTKPDLFEQFRDLTAEQVLARLDDLEAEAKGLRVLYRSLRARDRAASRRASAATESEEAHG